VGLRDTMQAARFPRDGSPTRLTLARAIGAGILLFDLTLMVASSDVWRDAKKRQARLAFVEAINKIIPTQIPLFATPEVGNPSIMVIAYRLRRRIDSAPINCAEPNAYFLAPLDGGNLAQAEAQILASSKVHEISLVRVLSDKPPAPNSECVRNAPYDS